MTQILTERELEVARLVAEGKPRKQVAKALDCAEGTVDSHINRIASKLPGPGRPAVRITRFVILYCSSTTAAA